MVTGVEEERGGVGGWGYLMAVYLAGLRRSPCWGAGRRRSAGFGSVRGWRRASPGLQRDGRKDKEETRERKKREESFHFDNHVPRPPA